MSAQIIDGKAISQAVRDEVAQEVEELKASGVEPCLAVMLVGEDPASSVYVGMKEKKCVEVGIKAVDKRLPADTSQETIDRRRRFMKRSKAGTRRRPSVPAGMTCLSRPESISSTWKN